MSIHTVRQLAVSAILTTVFLTGGVLHPSVATAATYYVATTGSDSRSCATAQTMTTPKQTIASGLSCLAAGDTLYLRGGTYNEAIDNTSNPTLIPSGTSWANPVTVAGYQNETVVVNGIGADTGNPVSYVIFDHLIIGAGGTLYIGTDSHHIRFTNGEIGNGPGCAYNCVEGGASFVEVAYSRIHDAQAVCPIGSQTSGCYGFYMWGHDNFLHHNQVYNNTGVGILIYNGGATNVSNNIVSNNLLYGNVYNDGTRGVINSSIYLSSGSNNQAYNNIVYGNTLRYGEGIIVGSYATNNQVYNNTIYGNAGYGIEIQSGSTGAVIENNISYMNMVPIRNDGVNTTLSHNLCDAVDALCDYGGDPLFVNAASRDFHIQAGSPARNAGLTISIVTTDYDSIPRLPGVGYAIGAYE